MPERSPDVLPNEPVEATDAVREDSASNGEPILSPEITARIGECLRLYYDNMMKEPVPEHLIRLVDRLYDEGSASYEA